MNSIIPFRNKTPTFGNSCFIAPTSFVIGDVTLADSVSIFFGAVLRGDLMPIRVGRGTNIQEHAVLHTTHKVSPCIVEENVTVGHRAILHGCTVRSHTLIGMGSIILDEAEVGEFCMIGAGSLVTSRTKIPPRSLAYGSPAKVVRALTEAEVRELGVIALRYQELGKEYQRL